MAKALYKGVSGVARNVENHYNGVSSVAKKVDNAYIGVSGVARQYWPAFTVSEILNDNDWATIRQVSDLGLASSYWSVGDRKAVYLSGAVGDGLTLSGTYYCYIIGINHNSGVEGTNRIHFQFGYTALSGGTHIAFCDTEYGWTFDSGSYFNMQNTGGAGGWSSSGMRTVICPAFTTVMPYELRSVLKTVTKYTDNVGSSNASYVTATTDTIFLLSEYEVFGKWTYANLYEQNYQKQYTWYANGNSKIRYKHNSTSTAAIWWLRSPYYRTSAGCCFVNNGSVGQTSYDSVYGFTPAFCV